MKAIIYSISILAVAGFFLAGMPEQKPEIFTSTHVALVELFTSQGCSSCPAADNLLNSTITSAESKGIDLIGLSYHVSYWNYIGWKDPYSSEQYTARQKDYAGRLQLPNIYTPQMIVNGTQEFVGSDQQQLASAIKKALDETMKFKLEAKATYENNDVVVHYTVDNAPGGELLNIAIVESFVQNDVLRGENKGLTLKHFNVVRRFSSQKLEKSGTVKVDITDRDFKGGTSIVLFVQDESTSKISGAVKITVKPQS